MTPVEARTLATYNQWMNEKIYAACERLTDAERKRDRGAFFRSIHGTLSHLLFGDRNWFARFTGGLRPEGTLAGSGSFVEDFETLKAERVRFDAEILAWTGTLTQAWLQEDLVWHPAGMSGEMRRPRWFALLHFFNHQTHHRGQVHCLLTQSGLDPGDTDLCLLTPSDLA